MKLLDVLLILLSIISLYALWKVLENIDAFEVIIEPYVRLQLAH